MAARLCGIVLFWAAAILAGRAQAAGEDPAAVIAKLESEVPPPNSAEVGSIDGILKAMYASISGPAGARDWNHFRSLFLPRAQFTESGVNERGQQVVETWNVDEFVRYAGEIFAKMPFFEEALANRVERYGNMVQVFSSYVSRSEPGGRPFQRGINSVQLMYDGRRWWVVSILWDWERPGNPLPKSMATKPGTLAGKNK
jgi:hypothetical protein